ncbi:hypothetical protein RB596_005662 [Gaeumannomyces avenae]
MTSDQEGPSATAAAPPPPPPPPHDEAEEAGGRFRVVIVGGGPAGLLMAHMLERAGVDWVVLERRPSGGVLEGAALALWPSSCRVLDQLGLLADVEVMHMPLRNKHNIRRDGSLVAKSNMMERIGHNHGYAFTFVDRQKLVDLVRRRLPGQERVLGNKAVVAIESTATGVNVSCADGSSVRGAIVVGCDGVRSVVRRLMADPATFPGQQPDKRWKGRNRAAGKGGRDDGVMKADYMGLVGHCPRPKDVPPETVWEERETGLSVTIMAGPDDLYFFVYKNRRDWLAQKQAAEAADGKKRGAAVEAGGNSNDDSDDSSNSTSSCNKSWGVYTIEDAETLAAEVADRPVVAGGAVTFGDVWAARTRASMLDFEEGMAPHWHRGRLVLASDAAVKMTPNAAFGLNTGIQGMVELTNRLRGLLLQQQGGVAAADPDETRLAAEVFAPYEKARRATAEFVSNFSWGYTRTVTWANLMWRLVDALGPYLGGDAVMLDRLVAPVIRESILLDFAGESDHRVGKIPWQVGRVVGPTATGACDTSWQL